MFRVAGFVLGLALVASGCRTGRYTISEPVTDQVIEVKSGDRINVELEANPTTGFVWSGKSDDSDVELYWEYLPPEDDGRAGVPGRQRCTMRVHRGFAGPAHVTLVYKRPWAGGETARKIQFVLTHCAEDFAPWR